MNKQPHFSHLVLLISSTILMLLTFSCSKKGGHSPDPSKKELLTSGSWKLTAVIADENANNTYETDRLVTFSDCFIDNFYTFHSNSEPELNEGPTQCDPGDLQTETSTWQLTQNETHLLFGANEYKLEELTATTLKWKESYAGGRSSLATFVKR